MLPWRVPIISAPMAGGPSGTPLVTAVSGAGGLGFLAAGFLTASALDVLLTTHEASTDLPYGVNLFLPSAPRPTADVGAYAVELGPTAEELGVEFGAAQWDDDAIDAKVEVVLRHRPSVVSTTFAAPSRELVDQLRSGGALVMATVTHVSEAEAAIGHGVDALCLQGAEAGGHRGVFTDDPGTADGGGLRLLDELLSDVRAVTELPLVAAGGLMTGADVRRVLDAGATAAQLGTAFLCCPEAGTSPTHRRALVERTYEHTAITRAFTGRPARGLLNELARDHAAHAPSAYPEVHHLTRPLRQAAAAQGRADLLHLWAGTGWRSVTEEPAAELVARLVREAGIH